MSKPIIVLVTLALVSSGASAYFWNELKTERASTQVLEQRIAQLEKTAVHRAPTLLPEPTAVEVAEPVAPTQHTESKGGERGNAQAQATFAVVAPSGAMTMSGPQMSDAERRKRMQEVREQRRRLMQDPEYRELMRTQQKFSMNHMYGDLELMLGLSKEDSERLRDLIAEQQMRQMENQPVFAASGGPPDPAQMQEYRQRAQEIQRKNDSEIAALLGPKYAEWQSYQQNSGARMQVMQLRQALATSDEPLRPDQVKPLVDAVAQEQKRVEQDARAQMQPYAYRQMDSASRLRMQEEWLERRQQTNERIRDAVSSLLSPSQLDRLTQQQDQEIKMQQVHLRMQRAQEEARARGELPADAENGAMMMGVPGALAIAD